MSTIAQSFTTGTAKADGTAKISFMHNRPGLQWVVPQFSVESLPRRLNATVEVQINGRYLTDSASGSAATASGPPPLVLESNTTFDVLWTGLTAGDQVIATLYYVEVPWGQAFDTPMWR